MMIVTYSKYFNYHFNKIILIFRDFLNEKLLDKKNLLALVNLIIGLGFCILNTLQYFCFYNKSLILYCKYFYFHLQLLFFNNYLLFKSKLLLYYLYNNSNKFNIIKKINDIEIIDQNNQVELLNNLIINQIDDFKSIRINVFPTKLKEENKKKIMINEGVFNEDNSKENNENNLSKDLNENEIVGPNNVYSILKNNISSKNPINNNKKNFKKNYFTVNTNNKRINSNFIEPTNTNDLINNLSNKKRSMMNFVSKNFNDNNSNLNLSNSNASYNQLVSNNNKTNSSLNNLNNKNNLLIKKKVIINEVNKKKKKTKLTDNDTIYFNKTGNKLLMKQILLYIF